MIIVRHFGIAALDFGFWTFDFYPYNGIPFFAAPKFSRMTDADRFTCSRHERPFVSRES